MKTALQETFTRSQKEFYKPFAERLSRCGWVKVAETDAGYREIWINHAVSGFSVLSLQLAHGYTADRGAWVEVWRATRSEYITE